MVLGMGKLSCTISGRGDVCCMTLTVEEYIPIPNMKRMSKFHSGSMTVYLNWHSFVRCTSTTCHVALIKGENGQTAIFKDNFIIK